MKVIFYSHANKIIFRRKVFHFPRLAKKGVVTETCYQMLEVYSFCDLERAQPPSMKFTVLTFLVNKCTIKFRRVSFFFFESISSNLEGLCTENRPET